ncbi:MAG: MFS transporter [Propionibacterium sp.]|nr:MFS transporter [Propionibacterium sp.]
MTHEEVLVPSAPWKQLSTTQADWDAADPQLLRAMLVQMQIIRSFEEVALKLASEGALHGPAHSSIGQEGGAVGSIIGLRPSDAVNGTHRGHHQFLAKGLNYLRGTDFDPENPVDDDVRAFVKKTLAEILGLDQGFSHGRGGSMHLQWLEAGNLGTNAIVGGGVPLANGSAFCQKYTQAEDPQPGGSDLTVTYFGDGASNIGSTLETMNLASAWHLPLCFFIENNMYAVSTSVVEATNEPRLSARASGFGMPAWRVDGMDPLAVYLTMQQAAEHMRQGKGTVVVEAEVYRYFHQNGPFPGSAFGYRAKEEEAEWRERDAIARVARELISRGNLTTEVFDRMVETIDGVMAGLMDEFTEADPESKRRKKRIRPELWPDPSFVDYGIRGDASELESWQVLEDDQVSSWREVKFADAAADVMQRRMQTDSRYVIMGEDVHNLKGGTNGVTRGLKSEFGDRILGTPICENGFAGLAGGIAMDGRYRPVVEFMYSDFMWVAADQVFNQIGKARHMFGGEHGMPLVLRSKCAMGAGYGSQHSMDPAGVYAAHPGWRIAAPSNAFDYVGLMNAALALEDPVMVIEHVDLYEKMDRVPEGDLDYIIPPGVAKIRRTGGELTILAYLNMVELSLAAVEATGIDAEVIDLRWLDSASMDWKTIGESIKKTNNVLLVEQGSPGPGYTSRIATEITERFFDYLDQPVQRVYGSQSTPTISKVLERAALAYESEIEAGIARVRRNLGQQA